MLTWVGWLAFGASWDVIDLYSFFKKVHYSFHVVLGVFHMQISSPSYAAHLAERRLPLTFLANAIIYK